MTSVPRRMRIDSSGVELYVEVWGESGLPLVLGHGFAGSARNFRPQARELAFDHRVVLFDARGHARSAAPTDPTEYDPGRFVADLGRVLDALGVERAVVGGLSMGAGVALRFALAHPERVIASVLSAFPRPADDPAHVRWATDFADAIEREGIEAAGRRHAWGERLEHDPRGAELVRSGFAEHTPHGLALCLRHLIAVQPSPKQLAGELAGIKHPVLVVVGEADPTSLVASRELAKLVPGARLVEIEAGGHIINLEKRQEYLSALRQFLDGLER